MNERIRQLAEQAGFENGHQDRDGNSLSNELEKFAELIAAEEREACAKVCEEHPDGLNMLGGAFVTCAAAIRARGNE